VEEVKEGVKFVVEREIANGEEIRIDYNTVWKTFSVARGDAGECC